MKKIIFTIALITFSMQFTSAQNAPTKIISIFDSFESDEQINSDNFAEKLRITYGLSPENNFTEKSNTKDKIGFNHIKYNQTFREVEIFGAEIILHEKAGKINSINGKILQGVAMQNVKPSITKEQAIEFGKKQLGFNSYIWETNKFTKLKIRKKPDFEPKPTLCITSTNPKDVEKTYTLCWKIKITSSNLKDRWMIFVDATNGKMIRKLPLTHSADVSCSGPTYYNGNRSFKGAFDGASYIYYENSTRGPNNDQEIVTVDDDNSGGFSQPIEIENPTTNFTLDPIANNVHWGMEKAYDFYYNNFQRNSFDDQGTAILNLIHFGSQFGNAGWAGGGFMIYGDGDGQTTNPFVNLDVEGHEFSHGVTEFTSALIYESESGALNESFSDIMAVGIEQFGLGSSYNWKIGEGINISGISHLRNMANPKNTNAGTEQPHTYQGQYYINTTGCVPDGSNDQCGVHINSGIPNYWFYLLSQGGNGKNDKNFNYAVAGIGLQNALKIVYRMQTVYFTSTADFADAVTASKQCATDLFPSNPSVLQAVKAAWCAVNLGSNCIPASVNTFNTNPNINASPNPNNGILHFSTVTDSYQIRLVDMKGTEVLKSYIDAKTNTINLTNIPNGLYLLQAFNDKANKTFKIVLEK
jgi:bacillolysin